MALNALRTEVVSFTGTPGIEVNGVTVGYKAEYTFRTGTEAKYHAIEGRTSDVASDANHKGQYYIQLGEQLYDGKLKLKDDTDVFGRPSRKWEYDGKGIGTYAKKELLDKEYVGEVTGKDLFDELGSTTLKDYTTYAFIDGVYTDADAATKTALGTAYFNAADMNKNNKAAVGGTGTGTLTQVYVDHDKDVVYVVVINTYLAIASKDYDTKKEEVDITAYAIDKNVAISEYIKVAKDGTKSEKFTLAIEDFDEAADIKKDDPLLITVADGEVQTIKDAEVLSAVTITAFKRKSNVTVDGTKYSYTTTAGYNGDLDQYTTTDVTRLKDRTYNVYLDQYGNLIGVEEVEAVKNYVFITGIDLNGSNRVNQVADASAIFLDGTMESIKVNMTKSTLGYYTGADDNKNSVLNTWCTYTVNKDVYTVTEVSDVGVTAIGGGGDGTKVPLGTNNANSKLAQFNQQSTTTDMTIDSKNYRMYGGGSKSSDYYNVYGDVDTVYITAKLGELLKGGSAGTNYGIIKDVASVTTGIANTDLYAWTNAKAVSQADADDAKVTGTPGLYPMTSSGVYGLYNNKGLIIAAVVVGEDAGTAKDLVYVHSSGLEEEIDNGDSNTKAAGDGLWTWTRKVIRNGEEVLLTEVGDDYYDDNSLAKMEQYKWYQIRTNAAGNVIEAKRADTVLNAQTGSRFVSDYDKINDNVELSGVDTVLYLTNGGPNSKNDNGYNGDLEVKGDRTLAVTNEEGSGIWFRDDVNVVLQYWNRNKQMDDIFTGEGVDDLKEMVDIVNDNNDYRDDNDYFVSALIEDGRATTIVIFDAYNNYKRPDEVQKPTGNGDVTYATGLSTAVDGAISNDAVTVQPNGKSTVKFTLTKPEWAYMKSGVAGVSVTFDVFMDGESEAYGTVTKNVTSTNYSTVTVNSNLVTDSVFSNVSEAKGHTLDVKITDVTWPAAKVEVWNKAGTAKLALTSSTTDNPGYLATASGSTLKFALNVANGTDAGTYSVTGALNDDDSAITDEAFGTNIGTAQTKGTVYAVGGQVVKVFVDATVTQNYTAKSQGVVGNMGAKTMTALNTAGVPVTGVPAGSSDWNATLAITAPAGPLAEGVTGKSYTINLANHTDGVVTEYDVSYTLTNGTSKTTGTANIKGLGSGTGSATVFVPAVQGDVDLTITSVKAKVMSFLVNGVTVDSDKLGVTISFTENAVGLSGDIVYSNSGNCIYITKDGSTTANASNATITADGKVHVDVADALETGATITIDAPVLNAANQQVKAAVITLTLTGDVWTYSVSNT